MAIQTEGDISIDLDTTELGVRRALQNKVAVKAVGAAIGQHTLIGLFLWVAANIYTLPFAVCVIAVAKVVLLPSLWPPTWLHASPLPQR